MPYFSVVIPLFNKANFVQETIQSVLSQTFTDFEIIVVDDASTDGGPSLVAKIADPRLRIAAHEKNLGLSAARNTGIVNSRANLVAFLDSDDLWKQNFLETIHSLTVGFPDAGIYATAYQENFRGKLISLRTNLSLKSEGIVDDFFSASLFQPFYWFGSAVVRKEVFETVGNFDTSITFGEDTDFNIRANRAFRLAYSPKECAIYRIESENQITRSGFGSKTFTHFGKYEPAPGSDPTLKKFLDVNRYFLALNLKISGNELIAKKLAAAIDPGSLSAKQKMLLNSPPAIVKMLRKIKSVLMRFGFRATSFSG